MLRFRIRSSSFPSQMDRTVYSLVVVYACQVPATYPGHQVLLAALGTVVNALCSLVVGSVYAYMLFKMRRDNMTSRNEKIWKFRFVIISIMNVICWWPAFVLYSVAFATGRSVYNGTFSPKYSEPFLVLAAAVTVANPVLYVIMSKEFVTAARRFGRRHCSCLDCCNRERINLRNVTGINIRVHDTISELTDTTALLDENSATSEHSDGSESN
ncbi:uncharacterized protein LOC134181558 [Corticium candelabrum]|uniref:uncharacterized protein LOC134181558 n=1 Tax=Corticium candelabrum TaxID=121492 RepID=UPI002E268466|nr:uncharacterized protein LOC134181558 [Corticium candelabrum]